MSDSNIVKIERGKYSPHFQVARSWISAASALAVVEPEKAIGFIDSAIGELERLVKQLQFGDTR